MLKKYLIVFFVSMVPLIELRGAIPIAAGMGLPFVQYYIIPVFRGLHHECLEAILRKS